MKRVLVLFLGLLVFAATAQVVEPPPSAHAAASAAWTARPEQYPGTKLTSDLPIRMSDGTVLRGDLMVPARADGTAAPGRWPVIVTITAYNKLATTGSAYLVKRGYAALVVDARGTGSSEGTWCAFCDRENKDGGEILTWAADQPWSNGSTGMSGASYLGISQIFAAAAQPKGLKAIFPIIPAGDVYRDVVASGGAVDTGFMPLWLGIVTATGIIPPQVTATDPQSGLTALAQHLAAIGTFTGPVLAKALAGADTAYDGEFYRQRSPLNVIDKVKVPTFLVTGEYDLFQRGTPMLFDRLQKRGVPVHLIDGPWTHIEASTGAGIEGAGLGNIDELELRWFDRYVRGTGDPALDHSAPISYYEQGTARWRSANHWLDQTDTRATILPLSGSAAPGTAGQLGVRPISDQSSTVLPIPVAGLCSRSTSQWTAGLAGATQIFNSTCFDSNKVNSATGVTFDTAPLTTPLPIFGPINAHLNVSSTTGEGLLSLALVDVSPDGSESRLTGGWQVISHRALDTSRTRYLDGRIIQPFHPFTQATQVSATPGAVVPVDVEIFPTGASIQPGHRLRLTVQAMDVPHLTPSLPEITSVASVLTIHSSPTDPSVLTLPTRDRPAPPAPQRTTGVVVPQALAGAHTRTHVRLHRDARRLRIRVRGSERGAVRIYVDGTAVGRRTVKDGRARFRLPQVSAGRHLIQVVFLGTKRAKPSTGRLVWRRPAE